MSDTIFAPASIPNLREVVFEKIREAIMTGVIPAGSKLSEIDLSRQFDVSRTPVREAIRQLVETGLVHLTTRRGAYVLLPTAKDTLDLYEIRTALEFISVEHLCANPPRDILLQLRGEFDEVSNDWDANRFMTMDVDFHTTLSKHANNSYLDFMLERVGAILQICRHYAIGNIPKVSSSREHIAIIDAILSRDVGRAREKMREHLENTRDALLEYISRHPEVAIPKE
ncbi:MAG: GntR family transcriptional regulator [Synergistaceae bacterium]|jgi:DNA-binding GntR family transcriptional regulator|nr:GntR family transcriptional regulator [Synergistaceae bacterium]